MYTIVIGQCIPLIQSTIKGYAKYISKYKIIDIIWLINKAKKTTAGVDTKANSELTLHENMMSLFTMRQVQTESDD